MNVSGVDLWDRARRYLSEDIWSARPAPGRSFSSVATRVLQLVVMIFRGFTEDQLLLRASALTYIATLSVIPLLVVALSLVKALGISEGLGELAVQQLTAGSPEARAQMLELVRGADLGGLGALGATVLFVTTVLALRHAEETLNEIWGVRRSRTWIRRFADYLALLIAAPLFTGVALSVGPVLQSQWIVQYMLEVPGFELLYNLGIRYAPVLLLVVGFSFIYWFLPNANVRVRAALLGGTVAAVLFTLAQVIYVEFMVGSARYSVLFGGFAALPLLLVWLYVSFAIFLLGAEVSFAYQNLAHYRRQVVSDLPGAAEREAVGLRIAVEVGRAFRDRLPPCTPDSLSETLDVPVRTVRDLLQQLEKGRIVSACAVEQMEAAYQLAAPAESIRVGELLAALRGTRTRISRLERSGAGRAVAHLLRDLDGSVARVADERSLADILEEVPRAEPA